MTGIRIIKIFLASSSQLQDDREQFEIFINRKNKEYIKRSIFLELVIWEDFLDAMSATRLQDEYNKAIADCDVFVSLFKTKVGCYTEEEFLKALETFKLNNKLLIYTYFKNAPVYIDHITDEISSLLNFKRRLTELGHFYKSYKEISELKYFFDQQLNKFIPELTATFIANSQAVKQESDQSLKSRIKQLEQQLEEKRSRQQQLENSQQSQIEEKESEIARLQNTAKSQQEKIEELNQKLKDVERSHSNRLAETQAALRQQKEELKQYYQSIISQLEQHLEQERSRINKVQADLQAAPAKIAEQNLIITQLKEQIEQLKSDLKPTDNDEVELISTKGINYKKLRDLLAAGEWKKADQETADVMLKVANRKSEGWLVVRDIDNFPCDDLRTINQLWLHYSKGKFGFSVPKKIYESHGGTKKYDNKVWRNFSDEVGWAKRFKSEMTFTFHELPRGYLPREWVGRGSKHLLSRKDL